MNADGVKRASAKPQWRIQTAARQTQKKERQRAWHPKARSGCQTCKRRKVRCDETKPVCIRCKKAGRTCEGYSPPKTWLFESPPELTGLSPSTPSKSTSTDLVRSPSSMGDQTSIFEQRALQFFKERTAPILSTFAPSAIQFWNNIVPRLGLSVSTPQNLYPGDQRLCIRMIRDHVSVSHCRRLGVLLECFVSITSGFPDAGLEC